MIVNIHIPIDLTLSCHFLAAVFYIMAGVAIGRDKKDENTLIIILISLAILLTSYAKHL